MSTTITVRFRALAALVLPAALLAAARPVSAQLSHMGPPRIYVSAEAGDFTTNGHVSDVVDKLAYGGAAQVVDEFGSHASGYADPYRFAVRATAYGSPATVPWARGQGYFSTYLNFLNVRPGATQPIDAFFHGALRRLTSRSGMAEAEMWFRVRDGDGVLLMEQTARQTASSTSGGSAPRDVAQQLSKSLDVPLGYSRFLVELGVWTQVRGPWEADFGSTVNVFLPPVEGVTWEGPDGVGSQQFVPGWASTDAPPVTTTPEPASIVLVAGGLVGLLALRRRRSTATA